MGQMRYGSRIPHCHGDVKCAGINTFWGLFFKGISLAEKVPVQIMLKKTQIYPEVVWFYPFKKIIFTA